jgi:hypothetical protein
MDDLEVLFWNPNGQAKETMKSQSGQAVTRRMFDRAASIESYRYIGLLENVGKQHRTVKTTTLIQIAHILKSLPPYLWRIIVVFESLNAYAHTFFLPYRNGINRKNG